WKAITQLVRKDKKERSTTDFLSVNDALVSDDYTKACEFANKLMVQSSCGLNALQSMYQSLHVVNCNEYFTYKEIQDAIRKIKKRQHTNEEVPHIFLLNCMD